MKVTGYANAMWDDKRNVILLAPVKADIPVIKKLFARKADREQKDGCKVYPSYSLEVAARDRTFKQNRAIWALITVIFRSMHGRKPTEEEKHDLYLDVLDMYAEKVPNRFTGALRPVHLSESDVYQAGRIITHLMGVLVEYCDLNVSDENGKDISSDLQADVRTIFNRWQEWKGSLSEDPTDCKENGDLLSIDEWTKMHPVSDASGYGGVLENAHIVSRGANSESIQDVRNLVRLTHEEHMMMHQYGWMYFLERFPHLRNRIFKAKQLFGGNEQ